MIKATKEKLRPFYIKARPLYIPVLNTLSKIRQEKYTKDIPIDRLLLGGNNGIRAYKYAEITNDFLMPSTLVKNGPYVEILDKYEELGEELFSDKNFEKTGYYKRALKCMKLTGQDFYDRPCKIIELSKSFIKQYTNGEDVSNKKKLHPGQSDIGAPIWVRPIKHSSFYEIVDGHHRAALAFKRKQKTIKGLIYNKEPTYTPLQQLLLDVMWINNQKWLYQPVYSPEINEEWTIVRQCTDRLNFMCGFLENSEFSHVGKKTYIDIASSYGWFVNEMLKRGYDSYGVERDVISIEVGKRVYGLDADKRIKNDEVTRYLESCNKKFDYVSCMSLLHHFVLNKNSVTAVDLIQHLDRITKKVLFIDTGQSHEVAFSSLLPEWNDEYVALWIKKHTSFSKAIPLGRDEDSKGIFSNYYNRTFFACVKG